MYDNHTMDVIQRNFFKILRAGAFGANTNIEPMSAFKWRRLIQMVDAQDVITTFIAGANKHSMDDSIHLPQEVINSVLKREQEKNRLRLENENVRLNNRFMRHRYDKIIKTERHAIDTSKEALDVLQILINNAKTMLNKGMSLEGIIRLGLFLRTKGDKVDFVKLENWLEKLHFEAMAQLQGNILISVFDFEKEEIPFVQRYEDSAYKLTMRSISDLAKDTAQEWHFKENSLGFLENNSSLMRRNLRRSFRYIWYLPLETISNFFHNFVKSLREIEE